MTTLHRRGASLLTFCIPTYNRVGSVVPLVRRVLECDSDEIEIVVADNCSTDDTLAQLESIGDPRLVVLRNTVNRGALFNQVNVLLQGSGIYSALLLDKDSVDPAILPAFLDFLRRESPSTGYCEYHQPVGSPVRRFQQGADALKGMAYSCHHPSGYFFRKADLHDIRIVERFSEHAVVGNFPFEFMQAELAMRGPAAIFQEPVFVPESLAGAKAVKSFTINAMKEDAFFSPKGRLNTAVRFSAHIYSLPLPRETQKQLVFDRFAQGLWLSTVGYRSVMANEAICEHYHIAPRRVSRLELISIATTYLRDFVAQLKSLRQGVDHPDSGDLLLDTVRRLVRRVGRGIT
ncbi:glycosyltransferase family 2 protein [Roseateles cellulosilyticus]|uniref:Glycosyltransferase n=1 Tax=Pelomonas cellulosilytica TaxID=2906762 RepID=A0ABS8Y422_9BURK|nr:glycosyltransferase [Pelomonas sp. P8]MCE4558042.1 glycosyltransferase [Pelomonas sp. P8]